MVVNEKYKDTMFCFLFGRPDMKQNLLELVNAISGSNYDNPDDLEVNTLEDYLYINMKNDVSCVIQDCLYSLEAQSTVNPNMPVRQLLYISDIYRGMLEGRSKYGRQLLKLPTPMCFVLCNAPDMKEDVITYRLSDAFADKSKPSGCEWTTTVYNINHGRNEKVMQACKALAEYAYFVECIRNARKSGLDLFDSIEVAVDKCSNGEVLGNILRKHRAEVLGMVFKEYNEIEERALERADGYKDGYDEGRAEGHAEGRAEGHAEGREKGRAEGQLEILISLVRDEIISIEEAAIRLNMTPEVFKTKMEKVI